MKMYSSEEYYEIVKSIYELIKVEVQKYKDNPSSLPILYPKAVIMYEFMRLLRGEAFIEQRQEPKSEHQKEYYQMEQELQGIINELKSEMDPTDDRTVSCLEMEKRIFDIS